MNEIRYAPIGVIHSPFKEPQSMPIQAAAAHDVKGTLELFPEYAEGLRDIEGFSHIYLIFNFHLAHGYSLRVKPISTISYTASLLPGHRYVPTPSAYRLCGSSK